MCVRAIVFFFFCRGAYLVKKFYRGGKTIALRRTACLARGEGEGKLLQGGKVDFAMIEFKGLSGEGEDSKRGV